MKTRNNSAVWIESAKRWQINVSNEDGIRKTFVCSTPGRKGQSACNRKADEWLAGSVISTGDRCDKLLDAWLAEVEIQTGASNYEQRKSITENWIRPAIGMMKLSRVKKSDLQEIINAAYMKGSSKKHLQNIRGAITNFLGKYDRYEKLSIPSDAIKKEKRILQPDDLNTLLTKSETKFRNKKCPAWYIHAWRFAAVTGLRPGELIALEWKHVTDSTIMVRGSVNALYIHTDGKNNNAMRDEPMTRLAASILAEQRKQLNDAGIVSTTVFPDEHGNTPRQKAMRNRWITYQQYQGISSITPYELRHTFVSVISGRSHMTIAELKSVIGHGKNMDTLGTYGHAMSDEMKRIAKKTDAAFASVKSSGKKSKETAV